MKWDPPHAPVHPPDGALPRRLRPVPRREREQVAPVRPLETIALMLGAASVFATLFSGGAAFVIGALFGLPALLLGRHTGRDGAVTLGWIGLGFAVVSGIAWMTLVM